MKLKLWIGIYTAYVIYTDVDVWNGVFTLNMDKERTPSACLLALFQELGDLSSIHSWKLLSAGGFNNCSGSPVYRHPSLEAGAPQLPLRAVDDCR